MSWDHPEPGERLTPKEEEAVRSFAQTGAIKLAALEMGITDKTFKNHLTAVYRKLDVDNCIEAFRALGWLTPPRTAPLHRHRWSCTCGAVRG
jgi:DNA-binding CsgD family transcriptional regulator